MAKVKCNTTPFKSGDRVKVYDRGGVFVGVIEGIPVNEGAHFVRHGMNRDGSPSKLNGWYWPQQIRKLKKREPRKWTLTGFGGDASPRVKGPYLDRGVSVEVVEVRK
jgi:hypothetical protein